MAHQPLPAWVLSIVALALAGAIVIRAHQVREPLRGLPMALPLLAYAGLYGYIYFVPVPVQERVALVRYAMLALFVSWLFHYSIVIGGWLWTRRVGLR